VSAPRRGLLPAQSTIRLKKRLLETSGDLQGRRVGPPKRRQTGSSHFLIQFPAPATPAKIAELRSRGVRVTSFVPDSALVVAAGDEISWDDLGLKYVGRLDELDKLSAGLSSGQARRTWWWVSPRRKHGRRTRAGAGAQSAGE